MNSLKAFLNPIKAENKEVEVSRRFVEDGKVVPFVIKPITQKENEDLIKKHTKKEKNGVENFNRSNYVAAMISSAVVVPDLSNAELQKAYNALGEQDLLKKMLLAGEYTVLYREVNTLSGFDTDINDEIEEVKNE